MKTNSPIRVSSRKVCHPLALFSALSALPIVVTACSGSAGGETEARTSDAVDAVREYFVSTAGNDSTGTGDEAHPFATIQRAANLTQPGDTVTVLEGTYTSPPGGGLLGVSRSGLANAWITYRGLPGQRPKLKFDGWDAISISHGASYIEITGFEIEGTINDTTLAFCTTQATIANPLCNGNGISVDGRNDGATKPHHILVSNNEVHDCAGGGISAIDADYITIENNLVHDNSWYTQYATSGISILTPFNFDQTTGYRNFIRNNQVWNNKTEVKWSAINAYSDGNGIILDTFSAPHNTNGDYVGRTLVTNNVSYLNGGSGIHAYYSGHVDIVNNTAYQNGQVVGYPDIFANTGKDVNILNDIMYARSNGDVNGNSNNTNVTYDYNVYFSGGTPAVKGPHDLIADPLFVSASAGDFRLQAGSPAIDRGTLQLAPTTDIVGTSRPQGAGVDVGAYETSSTPSGSIYTFGALAHPGSCLDARASGTTDGTQIQEWACDDTDAQTYQVVSAAGGAFNLVNTNAGKCVDVSGSGTANGTKIQLWDCNGTLAQTFLLKDAGNGSVNLVNTHSNKCLDVAGDRSADGTLVQLYDCNGTDAQLWKPTTSVGDGG